MPQILKVPVVTGTCVAVAALIENQSTLNTDPNRGKPFLRAENPKYPKMFPANELTIQGVMVALIRKRR